MAGELPIRLQKALLGPLRGRRVSFVAGVLRAVLADQHGGEAPLLREHLQAPGLPRLAALLTLASERDLPIAVDRVAHATPFFFSDSGNLLNRCASASATRTFGASES